MYAIGSNAPGYTPDSEPEHLECSSEEAIGMLVANVVVYTDELPDVTLLRLMPGANTPDEAIDRIEKAVRGLATRQMHARNTALVAVGGRHFWIQLL